MHDHHPDDDAVLLDNHRAPEPGEHAVATAVRTALAPDPSWDTQRLLTLAQAADHRATQRRRRRFLRTPALAIAGAATASALLLTLPGAFPSPHGGHPVAAGQDPALVWRGATLADLSPADVQGLLPQAVPLGPGTNPNGVEAAPVAPFDACGAAPLPGVATPLQTDSGQWGTSTTREVDDGQSTGTETTIVVLVDAKVDTFADPSQAEAAAAALSRSITTCSPRDGEQAPVYPYGLQMWVAPALYVSDYSGGTAWITAVWVSGPYLSTVSARVPVAQGTPSTSGVDLTAEPVPGADPASLDVAVRSVVDLARAAAQRASTS